ncbi:MAG: hypothetical protein RBU35_11605 [Anaerolineae bacterium]|jgi:hypothetical protein|nr:hypothetical protein [Anaerolineae bacterium]
MSNVEVRQQFSREVTAELYGRIRRLWIDHSRAENARDLEGLIATLAEDCVYEVIPGTIGGTDHVQ